MENKYWSGVMILVLVVMAAIGGEAADLSCEQRCYYHCRELPTIPNCYNDCFNKLCKHHPPTSTFHSQMKTRGMEEMQA
ncbi:hypothetical protein ISN44_As13g026890 [Arabidopsis suecica]|uniref:Plant thionin family protein n=1 Tax=Arabidopsis suecica TaxID=45249 RepID=A0A8T1XW96_ARASU|nr:hypothetical protein ISN44_As13g026890 [Arabidopsis suecica]